MTSPGGRVGVALVGYGYWGPNLARNAQAAEGLRLVAIADGSADRRTAAAAQYPAAAVVDGIAAVLARDDVDAVILATPAATHAELAQAVLASGRHVLVEKPLATTVEGAAAVVQAAEVADRVAMVGHTFLYSPPVHWLKSSIASGELGKLQYLYSQRLNLGRIRADCNALWNFGPHDVSIMVFLLEETPEEVSATGFSFLQPAIEDVCFATLRFPSGVGASLHLSWIDPRKTRLMTVVGDKKMAVYDDVSTDQKIWLYDAGAERPIGPDDMGFGRFDSMSEFQWKTRAGDVLIPKIAIREPLLNEMEAFAAACATGVKTPTDAAHGLEVVKVLSAIDESVRRGGAAVKVSP